MDLCNRNDIQALLQRHGFHFSKAMGQNFLIEGWVPRDIAAASGADEHTGVLEIGPGIGPLTRELARRVSLPEELLDRYPTHISGGEQQRVAIARGLTMDRRLLLADEPTGALDSASGAAVMELFQQLHDGGSTIIMITHDHSIANHAAKVMTIRDGVLSGGDDYE